MIDEPDRCGIAKYWQVAVSYGSPSVVSKQVFNPDPGVVLIDRCLESGCYYVKDRTGGSVRQRGLSGWDYR
jgi:hypothetical protein